MDCYLSEGRCATVPISHLHFCPLGSEEDILLEFLNVAALEGYQKHCISEKGSGIPIQDGPKY